MRQIRGQLRQLPRERRTDISRAIREGRAVQDSRDAALAASWAERLEAAADRFPRWTRWVLPLRRPRGWRARVWAVHAVWLTAAIVYAYVTLWHLLPGLWRWLLVGFLVYSGLTTPLTIRRMLGAYWNAPEAAKKNRELAE